MARRGLIHDTVRLALEKDGWTITADPFIVKVEGSRGIEIDLGAEKFIAAKKANEEIAVEIKSFASTSILNSFHSVLGQFLDYQDALEEGGIDRELFIAISESIYQRINEFPFILRRIEKYHINLVIVNLEQKEIISWKK